MSLADLPDELIAHIASFLNYTDTRSLMESSKKNYNAIKAYKRDKPAFNIVDIHVGDDPISFYAREKGNYGLNLKNYIENGADDIHESIKNLLDKCHSIDLISFPTHEEHFGYNIGDLTLPLVKILHETKAKIRSVFVGMGSVDLSLNEFIQFCRKFKGSQFIDCVYKFRIWSDEVLIHVFPHTMVGLLGDYVNRDNHLAKYLPDTTLKATIGDKEICKAFTIERVPNLFTVKQIVENLQILRDRNIDRINWNLGTLPANQYDDAENYFNDEFGQLKHLYDIEIEAKFYEGKDIVKYKLGHKSEGEADYFQHRRFRVVFSVEIEFED